MSRMIATLGSSVAKNKHNCDVHQLGARGWSDSKFESQPELKVHQHLRKANWWFGERYFGGEFFG